MGALVLFILRGIVTIYWIQPRSFQVFWGNVLGYFLYFVRFRSKVVRENIRRAFPGQPQIQDGLFKKSYFHLGNLILEILLLLGPMKQFVLKYLTIQGVENIVNAKEKGNGIIFLASHVGNWEVMAVAGALKTPAKLLMVTKHLKPEWLHQAIKNGRLACEVKATYEPRTLKDVLSHLKKNEAVGIVLDQYVGPPVGIRVPFFNAPVGTSMLVATLAKRTGAAVLPVDIYRKSNGHWVLEIQPPVEWISHADHHFELAVNTAKYTSLIESSIRKWPEQWLWTHRRFKGDLAPLGDQEWLQSRVRK